ncbi:hypothetical protein BAC1_01370 [uncultured bacterium]|nr:hypothetical protein BAC1_01370 [uncultured bacterium]
MGHALNKHFLVNFSDEQWRETLEPARQKTIMNVCELLSTRATRVAVKPFPIAGGNCLSAGSFLAVRTALTNAGLPVAQVKPSTMLAPYLGKNWSVFWSEIDKIAPGILTDFKIKYHLHYLPICLLVIGILSAALSQYLDIRILLLWPLIFIGAVLSAIILRALLPPKKVQFGDMETFGDLSRLVEKHHFEIEKSSRVAK